MVRFALGTGRRLFFSQSRLGGGVVPAPSSHSFRFVCQSEHWRGAMKAKASVPGGGGAAERKQEVVARRGHAQCWNLYVRVCLCVHDTVVARARIWWAAPWPCMGSWLPAENKSGGCPCYTLMQA